MWRVYRQHNGPVVKNRRRSKRARQTNRTAGTKWNKMTAHRFQTSGIKTPNIPSLLYGLSDKQVNPFSPGGFTAYAASTAQAFLALLLKNHSPCVFRAHCLHFYIRWSHHTAYTLLQMNRQRSARLSIHVIHSCFHVA